MTVYSSQERYRLEREIGQGAMGQVWLATDTLLDRPVAVKYPLVTSSVNVGQLLQEARMLAQLNHANITTLYDFFVEPGPNRFFLVMEYVEGKSLDMIIKDRYRVLDNFEHLLDGVNIVTDILETAPEVKVLVTSRATLNLQGEHLFAAAESIESLSHKPESS